MGFFGGGGAAGVGGATGSKDNAILRADGTGGATLQGSALVVSDEAIAALSCTGVASTDIITAVGHTYSANQAVRFLSLTGGSGLNTTTTYYVRDISGNTFKVSTTSGGGAVNFTTDITNGTVLAGEYNVSIENQDSQTNSSIVITPKGTGALILGPRPDGTSTGGAQRGIYSVDLQLIKAAVTQIASGTYSAIVGGINNTASGSLSCVIAGSTCYATGDRSICAGNSSIASGNESLAFGLSCVASSTNSIAIGNNASANRVGMIAQASARFSSNQGTAQKETAVLSNKTTTNSAVELFLDGTTGAQRFSIPSGRVTSMLINITGVKSDGSAVAHYVRQYSIKNVGGTTSEVYAAVTIGTDNAAGTSIAISANDTNDALKIECTGIASETWRWVASVDAVEVAYGT